MAFEAIDFVFETSTAPGTASFTLNGAVQGARSFASGHATGATVWYTATDGTSREVGVGTFTAPSTLARTEILASTNGGAIVNFATGTVSVFEDLPASKAKVLERLAWAAAAITPVANDGTALGTGANSFSDLFLATGGQISFNNGDVLITHATDILSFAGATSGYRFSDGLVGPAANDGVPLGGASNQWSDLFLASGGVINWANGDVTITHSPNTLAIAGASSGYTFDSYVLPATDDGAPLGSTGLKWADLFLASGGVVNWANGDVTITQSTNLLEFAGASSGYNFDALLNLSGAAAGQIKFPATQNASADVNTLDDYEEGTWTPDFTFATPGNLAKTFGTATGSYIKIGKKVTVTFNMGTTSFTHTTASGDLSITGLPFPAQNVANDRWRGTLQFGGITKVGYTNFTVGPVANATTMILVASGSGASISLVGAADMPTGGTINLQGSVTYMATS